MVEDKKKRKRRTKKEMEAARRNPYPSSEPEGFKSLVGTRRNYEGQRVKVITHYFDGRLELAAKDGTVYKIDPNKKEPEDV